MRRKKSPYSGKLNTPLRAVKTLRTDLPERIKLLYRHYGISSDAPDANSKLTAELIVAHVPGFQLARLKNPGRPRTKSSPEAREARRKLLEIVEGLKASQSGLKKDSQALRYLLSLEGKKKLPGVYRGKSFPTLKADMSLARQERNRTLTKENINEILASTNPKQTPKGMFSSALEKK